MKQCTYCGFTLPDEAVFCSECGRAVVKETSPSKASSLDGVIKAFLILGTVVNSLLLCLIPLAWCLPMTISGVNKMKRGEPISTGYKVCVLLFVNTIAGILLLCRKDS